MIICSISVLVRVGEIVTGVVMMPFLFPLQYFNSALRHKFHFVHYI